MKPEMLATGIGSLPHLSAAAAMEVIAKNLPEIPHWPQLPKFSGEQGFINQYLRPLKRIGLFAQQGEKYFFDTAAPDWPDKLAEFFNYYLAAQEGDQQALEFFAFPPEAADGFYTFLDFLAQAGQEVTCVKGQIAGPVSMGLNLVDQNRKAAYYQPQLRELLVKTLAMEIKWQVTKLKEFGKPVLMFIDDPGVYFYGLSTHVALSREDIVADLSELTAVVHEKGELAGIHSCAGNDWSLLLDSHIDILSFDAYNYFYTLAGFREQLKTFLAQGGILAWGVVPTSDQVHEETPASLQEKLTGWIEEFVSRGFDRDILYRQSLITPSCGTGTLPEETAERVYLLTRELSAMLRR